MQRNGVTKRSADHVVHTVALYWYQQDVRLNELQRLTLLDEPAVQCVAAVTRSPVGVMDPEELLLFRRGSDRWRARIHRSWEAQSSFRLGVESDAG